MKPARSESSKPRRGTKPRSTAAGATPMPRQAAAASAPSSSRWTFLTNHSHVLILLAGNPSMVLREVAAIVGITERAVQRIIADLEEGGFIERKKAGRQNHYRILPDRPLRHPIEADRTIGDLLRLMSVQRHE